MNLEFERKLTIPMQTKAMYPVTAELEPLVAARAETLRRIFEGLDDRLLLVIGPCSADRPDSVLEYLTRLRRLQEQVEEKIFMVPRLFTNKPRTTGDGYMGLVHQPVSTGRPDPYKGIIAVRELHLRALRETGFTCADEMLYPENHRYLDDLLAYVSVGARSVEDQQHRLTASGLEIPVGMKNPLSGDLQAAIHSVTAAQHRHTFIYRGWAVHSQGNPHAHVILRGYLDREGRSVSNYDRETLLRLKELYDGAELENPAFLVDANHANSGKDPFRQPEIVFEVLRTVREEPSLRRLLKGFMVESYLADGCQPVGGGVYGQSITDPCLGWEKTERLVLDLAEAL